MEWSGCDPGERTEGQGGSEDGIQAEERRASHVRGKEMENSQPALLPFLSWTVGEGAFLLLPHPLPFLLASS